MTNPAAPKDAFAQTLRPPHPEYTSYIGTFTPADRTGTPGAYRCAKSFQVVVEDVVEGEPRQKNNDMPFFMKRGDTFGVYARPGAQEKIIFVEEKAGSIPPAFSSTTQRTLQR
jgi:hypothetical protein